MCVDYKPPLAVPGRRTNAHTVASRPGVASRSFRSARHARALFRVDGTHGADGVGFVGALVRTIALDACEPQRESRRISRARLEVIERHFDHELRPHVHDMRVASDLALEQRLRLPREN